MEAQGALRFQFITEQGDGKRPHPKSTKLSAIRSQARKHTVLEQQRRKALPKVVRRQILQKGRDEISVSISTGGNDEVLSLKNVDDSLLVQSRLPPPNSIRGKTQGPGFYERASPQSLSPTQNQLLQLGYYQLMTEMKDAREALLESKQERHTNLYLKPRKTHHFSRHDLEFARISGISPQTLLGAGRVDPFASFPVKAQPYVHRLVDFMVQNYATNSHGKTVRPEDRGPGYERLVTQWIPLCMKNAMAFNSFLLAAETGLLKAYNLDPWSRRAIHLSLGCTEWINREIDQRQPDVSDMLLATVVNVACCDLTFGERAKYQRHMKGLNEMIRLRGGLENIEFFLRDTLAWVYYIGGEPLPPPRNETQETWTSVNPEQGSNAKGSSANLTPRSRTVKVMAIRNLTAHTSSDTRRYPDSSNDVSNHQVARHAGTYE